MLTGCLFLMLAQVALLIDSSAAGAVAVEPTHSLAVAIDSQALRIISDEDQAYMQQIKGHIEEDFANFKTINDVHVFLDNVRLMIQKHPKNLAFAHGDLKELHKFLSQEIIAKLIRVDTEPFKMPITEERLPLAQRALDDDELTRKLFSVPLRNLIEMRKQQMSRSEDGNHKDGNFFTNFWCRISGGCSN